jgi:hypothetical protein
MHPQAALAQAASLRAEGPHSKEAVGQRPAEPLAQLERAVARDLALERRVWGEPLVLVDPAQLAEAR